MAKSFESQIINSILTGFIEELITNKGGLAPSQAFEVKAMPIEEYEGRMRVNASDQFDVAVLLAATSFYLNKADMQVGRAKGAMVLYMDTEVADKIFKAVGLQVPFDEDDESMLALCGKLCQSVADHLRERLSAAGYISLEASQPAVYKNTVSGGLAFSRDQDEKQEILFYFLKHKALAIEWTLAPIPKK